jgi:uncharacterized coiled-coil protein SlyX
MSHADELLSAMEIKLADREQTIREFHTIIRTLDYQQEALRCQCKKLWKQNKALKAQNDQLQAQAK